MPENSHYSITRRGLLANTVAGLAVAGLPLWFAERVEAETREQQANGARKFGPNDQINVGAIGVGGRKGGYQQGLNDTRDISGKPGVKIVAVCDVDDVHRDEGAANFGSDCAKIHDFRDLLARKDIDAVVIGTPDHWHCTVAAAALRAGKDVYCEKPLTLTIDEGKRLVKVAKETKRIFQVGSQQRSDPRFRMACELVRNGRLGKITKVTAHLPTGPTGGPFAPQPVPADFDWNMWLGPAPEAPYMPERSHGNFRWWLDYSGGMMTDWGAHHNDIAQWGLGTDRSGPISVEALGKGPTIGTNCYNIFPEFDVTYTYPDGVTLLTTNKGDNGVMFEGEAGWIFVSRSEIKASDQKLLDAPLPSDATRLYASDDHKLNFVEGIRTRKPCICDTEIGHRSATLCHLANISLRLGGRKLDWDPAREQFKSDKEADTYLARTKRGNWRV